ncbi:MAG: ribonuclease HII [Bacteroidales bacterium]|nr:ribonuclease HII [Bacteroidales bacterium]
MLRSYHNDRSIEAGCDEAGRGCLAGPVFAAAVILPEDADLPGLDDSKKLSKARRNMLRTMIEKTSLSYGIASAGPEEIDKINILNASFLAMHRALDQLSTAPDSILVDGNRFSDYRNIQHHCIIKGDGKYLSIAAASVLAKTYRDDYMEEMDRLYPEYQWKNNKGYPTMMHRVAIIKYGITPLHRKSFRLMNDQLEINF